MTATTIVVRLDIFEHIDPELVKRGPWSSVDEFFLESCEERLGGGVVVDISRSGRRSYFDLKK
jgi:hypothetical protein